MSVVPSTVETLSDYADQVLTVAFNSLNTTTAGAPDRVYVAPAPPAFDCCPMLSVVVASLQEDNTSPVVPSPVVARRTHFGNIIIVDYQIWAIRCAPVMDGDNLPTPAQIAASALEVQEDGWALWNGFRHAILNEEIFEHCLGAYFDGGLPIAEQGGCVGWLFSIRASIPGIPLEDAS
jgi:hypothetical protein